jgi:hypothetical protein
VILKRAPLGSKQEDYNALADVPVVGRIPVGAAPEDGNGCGRSPTAITSTAADPTAASRRARPPWRRSPRAGGVRAKSRTAQGRAAPGEDATHLSLARMKCWRALGRTTTAPSWSCARTLAQRACRATQDQAAPLAMIWNTNPSTVIPTATAAIGSRTSAVAFAPLTGPVQVSNSPAAQSRKLR